MQPTWGPARYRPRPTRGYSVGREAPGFLEKKSTKIYGKHAGNVRETTRMDSEQINEKKREREATSAYGMGGGNGGEEKMKKKRRKTIV